MKALGVDTKALLGMSVAHASLTVIRVGADGSMTVLAVGDVGHLPPSMQSWGADADPELVARRVRNWTTAFGRNHRRSGIRRPTNISLLETPKPMSASTGRLTYFENV